MRRDKLPLLSVFDAMFVHPRLRARLARPAFARQTIDAALVRTQPASAVMPACPIKAVGRHFQARHEGVFALQTDIDFCHSDNCKILGVARRVNRTNVRLRMSRADIRPAWSQYGPAPGRCGPGTGRDSRTDVDETRIRSPLEASTQAIGESTASAKTVARSAPPSKDRHGRGDINDDHSLVGAR